MKHYIYRIAAIAAIMAGCTEVEPEPAVTPEVNDGQYTIKAVMSDVTKTSIADNGTMAWITGDKIDVYDGGFNEFTLQGEASGEEATFKGDIENPESAVLAICPAGIGGEVADEMIVFDLPSEYEYDGQSTHAPMIATGFAVNDHEATVRFKHIGGLFKVTYNHIPAEARSFNFEATKQITGELYIEDYTAENAMLEAADDPDKGGVVTYCIEEGHPETMSFYVPVPTGTFDFNINLRNENGEKIAKSSKTKRNFTIERGDYVNIPAVNLPQTLTENFNSTGCTSDASKKYGSTSTFTDQYTAGFDYTWVAGAGTQNIFDGGIKLGSSGKAGDITSSDILSTISSGTVFTVKVYASSWSNEEDLSISYGGKTLTKVIENIVASPNNKYYSASDFTEYVEYVFMKDGENESLNISVTSGARVLIDKIIITEGGELPKAFGVSATSLEAEWDETTATFDIIADEAVSWEIVADDGLTLSQDEGTGNATITVTFSQNDEEEQLSKEIVVATEYSPVEDESTYTITFTQSGKPEREMDGDGKTAATAYSVADAIYIAEHLNNNETTDHQVFVTGTITALGEFSSGTYSYTIGTGDDQFEVYKGKDLGNVKFSEESDLSVGQTVVIYGKIKKYVNSSNTTLEMDSNNYLISIDGATTILKGITLSGQTTSFMQGDAFVKATVTASYRGMDDADVTDQATFTGYNMSTIGEQTVTVTYAEGGVEKSATYTITVNDNSDYTIGTDYDNTKGSVVIKVNGAEASTAKQGQTVTVIVTPGSEYVIDAVTVGSDTLQGTDGEYTFTMPASNVTVTVTFDDMPAGYTKISNVSDITTGDYIIAAKVGDKYYAMPNASLSGKPAGAEVTVTNNTIAYSNATSYKVRITKDDEDKYYISNGSKYLGYSSSTNFAAKDTEYAWNFGGGTNGSFRATSASSSNRGIICRAGDSNIFGAYATSNVSASGTEYYDIELFKAGGENTPVDATWSVSPASITVNAGQQATATITTDYDGTLSVESDATVTATATISGKVITVNGVAAGTTTLTVTGEATTNFNAISKTINVTVGQPTCADPTANPAPGAVSSGTTVSLSSATASAKVYYSIDDIDGTYSEYTEPISITAATTIYAYAAAAGYKNSEIVQFDYTIAGSGPVYEEKLFTIKSADIVTNSSYAKYETTVDSRKWLITFGGNNKSVGTNSGNRSKCVLGSTYSKYAISGSVSTSDIASAYACLTKLDNVKKISYTFNGGSSQTTTNVYLVYSEDNTTYSTISLTSGTQGAAISSGTTFEFNKCSGYFALVFKATNSSGNWRIDDVNLTFTYEEEVK